MDTYETLRQEVRRFGKNSYLEVSRQRLRSGRTSEDFLVVTRGFFNKDGTRQWTRFVTIPDDKETRAWLRECIGKM